MACERISTQAESPHLTHLLISAEHVVTDPCARNLAVLLGRGSRTTSH